MARYSLTPRARRDLDDIWTYSVERWDEGQAMAYVRELRSAIEAVADRPSRGRPCDDIRPGYFKISRASHVVFYRLLNGEVEVVRILHQRMDFTRHL